jgi:phosphosulfolactate synthase
MSAGSRPTFLDLPERSRKPRTAGITHLFDKGCTLPTAEGVLASSAAIIDVWKFGFGTSYIDPAVRSKIAILHTFDVKACTGGTLLEVAWLQGRINEFFAFAADLDFDCVEVSDGATTIPRRDKGMMIARARELGFEVMSEVGSKDPAVVLSPSEWSAEVDADIAAGATWIVAEGRESGTVGLYDENGTVRQSLLHVLQRSRHASQIIYEAPQRAQQAFLIRELGSEVNLGNILIDEVMSVEALRLGLRADTLGILPGTRTAERERGLNVRV